MKITLEMVLTKFFAEFNNAKLLTSISDAQMQHALQGIQLLPRHMHSLSADYLYVTDQFYYSAEICKDSGKVNNIFGTTGTSNTTGTISTCSNTCSNTNNRASRSDRK